MSGSTTDELGLHSGKAGLYRLQMQTEGSCHARGVSFIKELPNSWLSQYTAVAVNQLNGIFVVGGSLPQEHMLDTCYMMFPSSHQRDYELPKTKHLRR